jgi:hypothetical protein
LVRPYLYRYLYSTRSLAANPLATLPTPGADHRPTPSGFSRPKIEADPRWYAPIYTLIYTLFIPTPKKRPIAVGTPLFIPLFILAPSLFIPTPKKRPIAVGTPLFIPLFILLFAITCLFENSKTPLVSATKYNQKRKTPLVSDRDPLHLTANQARDSQILGLAKPLQFSPKIRSRSPLVRPYLYRYLYLIYTDPKKAANRRWYAPIYTAIYTRPILIYTDPK